MAEAAHNWESIDAADLRIGLYIKIDHHWFDHPFVRNIFQISADSEIKTIRESGLTRLYVDYAASNVAVPVLQPLDEAEEMPDADRLPTEEEWRAEQAGEAQEVLAHREVLERASAHYTASVHQARSLLSMLNATDTSVSEHLGLLTDANVEALLNGDAPLALVAAQAPWSVPQRMALLGIDAMGICGALGKRMGLSEKDLRILSQAAGVHLVGLQRLPYELREELRDGSQLKSQLFRRYPELSARVAAECGGFSPTVIRVVREHRELPDGSGFPHGLPRQHIHPLALLLGAVRCYQVQCTGEGAEPAAALSYMYRNMREVYGEQLIAHLVSTLTVYPPGSFVELSDGSIGCVLRVNEDNRLRPVVGIVKDHLDIDNARIVDLAQNAALSVVRLLGRTLLPGRLPEQCRSLWTGMAISPLS